jgi:polysaccharide biosynthesis protein PslG
MTGRFSLKGKMMKPFIAWCVFSFISGCLFSAGVRAQSDAIPKQFFGLHMHRADRGTVWPNIPFGSWRLWDANVTWAEMEPTRGKWNFSRLDRYLAMAEMHDVEILMPLANTPGWAAARPGESSAYSPGNASEPASIDDWRRFVRTLGERYKGRIRHYEMWNEPNHTPHFSGSISRLVELTCEASKILKSIDPSNQIVSPAISATGKDHLQYFDRFLATGGAKCIDVVSYHFYVTQFGPEAMVPIIRDVRRLMSKNGVSEKPLWNTETGWRFDNDDGTPLHPMTKNYKKVSTDDTDFVLKAFVLSKAEGVDRFYWYAWDNLSELGMIHPKTGAPKAVVQQWRDAHDRLFGASGVRCSQSGNKWGCSFVRKNGSNDEVSWSAK